LIFPVAPPVMPPGITAEDHTLPFIVATMLPGVVVVPLGLVEALQPANTIIAIAKRLIRLKNSCFIWTNS
jgi:hypothetical protein